MASARLTARTVTGAKPAERAYVLYDEDLKGFGLRVMPSGFKSWVVEYRPAGAGRTASKKRVALGSASSLTSAEARKLAKDMLAAVRGGADPLTERATAKAAASIAQIAPRFLSEHVARRRKPKTVALYKLAVDRHIVPALGSRKAASLTKAEVIKLHGDISERAPVMANRVVAVLGSMMSWAQKVGLVPEGHNPVTRIEKNTEQGRERYLTTAELERLGKALHEAETVGIPWDVDEANPNAKHLPKNASRRTVLSPYAVAALRLLLLTGARVSEVLKLRWSEVDFDRGLLLLPDSKTGRKTIILNAPALAVLEGIPRLGEFVIAGRGPTNGGKERPRSDLKKPWAAICRHAELEGVRLHDLRHSFASVGAGAGLGLPIVGKLLGHTEASTTQRYAHLDNDPLRRASNTIGEEIATKLAGGRRGHGERDVTK